MRSILACSNPPCSLIPRALQFFIGSSPGWSPSYYTYFMSPLQQLEELLVKRCTRR